MGFSKTASDPGRRDRSYSHASSLAPADDGRALPKRRSWWLRYRYWTLSLVGWGVSILGYIAAILVSHGATMAYAPGVAKWICAHATVGSLVAAGHAGAWTAWKNKSNIQNWFKKKWHGFKQWQFSIGWRQTNPGPYVSSSPDRAISRREVSSAVRSGVRRGIMQASLAAPNRPRARSFDSPARRSPLKLGEEAMGVPGTPGTPARRSVDRVAAGTGSLRRAVLGRAAALAASSPASPAFGSRSPAHTPQSSDTLSLRRHVLSSRYAASPGTPVSSPICTPGAVHRRNRVTSPSLGTPTQASLVRLPWTPEGQREAREISSLSTACQDLVKQISDLLRQLQQAATAYKPSGRWGITRSAARTAVYKQVQVKMIERGLLPGMFPCSPNFGLQVAGSPPYVTNAAWRQYQQALKYRVKRLSQLRHCLNSGIPCFAVEGIDMRASGLNSKKAVGKAVYYFMTIASMNDASLRSVTVHDGAHVVYGAGGDAVVGSAPAYLGE